ncbi:hypothetical protein EJ07DRAFT_155270 [Lizonia empirigonia]|nr:hypothetical protein EJ07DRAFT_155270 [Lizonia empirigonia]
MKHELWPYPDRVDATKNRTHTPRMRSPSMDSWCSENEGLSPRTSNYYKYLYATDGDIGGEHSTNQNAAHLGSGESGGAPTFDIRKASTVTLFPTFTTSIKTTEPKLQRTDADIVQRKPIDSQSNLAKGQSYVTRLKEIYREGPPGEGKELWTGLRNYWRERKRGEIFELCTPNRPDGARLDFRNPPPQPQRRPPATTYVKEQVVEPLRLRRDSGVSYDDVSRTSREVPVKIRRTILTVNTNKSLPPTPRLIDPPQRRLQVTQEPPKPVQEVSDEPSENTSWSPTHTGMVGSLISDTQNKAPWQSSSTHLARSKHVAADPQPHSWLQGLASTASDDHIDVVGNDNSKSKSKRIKAAKSHSALKATISRPIPIPVPPAASLSPTRLPPRPDPMSEKVQGKQKAPPSPTWLNKIALPTMPTLPNLPTVYKTRKRPDSDESFACQGLREEYDCDASADEAELSVQDGGPRMRGEDDAGLVPEPLFAGRMRDGSYYDVADVYADQRGTGRWM